MNRTSRWLGWGTGVAVLALAGFVYAGDENNKGNSDTGVDMQVGKPGVSVNVQHGMEQTVSDLRSGNFVVRPLNEFYKKDFYNGSGKKIGEVHNLVIDPRLDQVVFAITSFDRPMHEGDKYFAIPWTAIHKDINAKDFGKIAYSMNVDRQRLQNARSFDKDRWPDLADRSYIREVYSYWNQQPYWEGVVAQIRQGPSITGTPISPQAQQKGTEEAQRERLLVKASDVVDHELLDSSGQKIGELKSVMVAYHSGALVYGVTKADKAENMGDKMRPFPFELLSFQPANEQGWQQKEGENSSRENAANEKNENMAAGESQQGKLAQDAKDFRVVLNTSLDKLRSGPSFDEGHWPNMTPQWGRQVYDHYGVKPFWNTGQTGARQGMEHEQNR